MNPIRLAWVPPWGNNLNRASYRLECWYPHQWLSRNGFESTVLTDFPTAADRDKYDFLIWFRTDCPERAFDSGIPVVYFLTDGPRPSDQQLLMARGLVTDCDLLYDEVRARWSHVKIAFIHDTFDSPPNNACGDLIFEKPLRHMPTLVWVGSQGGYPWAKETIERLRKNWKVEVISDHAEATKPWSIDTISQELASCDIGIIPYPEGLKFGETNGFQPQYKDINRVVLLQSAGLPVVAAPLPAYLNYIRNGVDGMIADGPDEFEASVAALANNPAAAQTMAHLGWLRAWTTASPPFTGSRWRRFLNAVAGR